MTAKRKTFADQLGAEQMNPAMQFISTPAPAPAPQTQPEPPAHQRFQPERIPEGYRLNPRYVEKKTRRVQLLLRPSVYDAVKARADSYGVSVNDLINSYLEDAVRGPEEGS